MTPTTQNAPQPRLTRVCAEAETESDHAGCSGGFCTCECHTPTPAEDGPALPRGRFGVAPPHVLAELEQLRDQRRRGRRGRPG